MAGQIIFAPLPMFMNRAIVRSKQYKTIQLLILSWFEKTYLHGRSAKARSRDNAIGHKIGIKYSSYNISNIWFVSTWSSVVRCLHRLVLITTNTYKHKVLCNALSRLVIS